MSRMHSVYFVHFRSVDWRCHGHLRRRVRICVVDFHRRRSGYTLPNLPFLSVGSTRRLRMWWAFSCFLHGRPTMQYIAVVGCCCPLLSVVWRNRCCRLLLSAAVGCGVDPTDRSWTDFHPTDRRSTISACHEQMFGGGDVTRHNRCQWKHLVSNHPKGIQNWYIR